MRRYALVLCGLAVLLLACPSAAARKDKPKAEGKARKDKAKRGGKGGLKGYYAIMASVLELTDEQKAKMTEAIAARDAALKEWDDGESGRKLAELMKKAKEAGKEDAKGLRKEAGSLRKERAELEAAQKVKIMEILTEEQKVKWEGHLLYTQAMRRFKKVGLTEEQEGKIRALCAAKGADAIAAAGDRKALKKLRTDLAAAISADVLTEEQRTKAAAKKEKPAAKKEKPAGKPKKEKKEK